MNFIKSIWKKYYHYWICPECNTEVKTKFLNCESEKQFKHHPPNDRLFLTCSICNKVSQLSFYSECKPTFLWVLFDLIKDSIIAILFFIGFTLLVFLGIIIIIGIPIYAISIIRISTFQSIIILFFYILCWFCLIAKIKSSEEYFK